jgi:hypothetical protein
MQGSASRVIILSVAMVCVVMLNVIMLDVAASKVSPSRFSNLHKARNTFFSATVNNAKLAVTTKLKTYPE